VNIIAAIKSGQRFRRPKCGWFDITPCHRSAMLTFEDIIADDWEIEDTAVSITRKQYWEAVRETLKECESDHTGFSGYNILEPLAKRLGLSGDGLWELREG
jgi:hypothetical protein